MATMIQTIVRMPESLKARVDKCAKAELTGQAELCRAAIDRECARIEKREARKAAKV